MIPDRQTLRAALREKFPRNHGQLLPALHFLQHEFGYLPDWAMEVVGWHLGIPASEVYGAATSYSELRVQKPGAHVLRVCTGLSCWMNGGKELLEAMESELGVRPGQTTSDGLMTFEETPCGFLCCVAPAVQLDGSWRGRATPELVKGLLQEVSR
jgi:NADH:ubiquinone oxidoreductase subunit E